MTLLRCGYLAHVSAVTQPFPTDAAPGGEGDTALVLPSSSTAHCCELCWREPQCRLFSRDHPSGACSLLRQPATFMRDSAVVCGWPRRDGSIAV